MDRRIHIFLLISFLFAMTSALTACGEKEAILPEAAEPRSGTVFAMDTVMELRVYGPEGLIGGAEDIIYSLESKLSVTDEGSEINALNRNKTAEVSDDTAELISRALDMCRLTKGALDISVYPVLRAWGFTTGEYSVPTDEVLAPLLEKVDYRGVELKGVKASIGGDMEIDLGSVAKGYTGDKIMEYWRGEGATSALLNLGGNVHALGSKPDGSPWRVAIADPLGQGNLAVLDITDKAVITSGGYERYFEEDGNIYWHLIDPATGYPARSGLISVTVVGDNGLKCDALSTALFVMGLDEAAELWRAEGDFEAVFVEDDGSVTITEGLRDTFSLVEGYKGAEIKVICHDKN